MIRRSRYGFPTPIQNLPRGENSVDIAQPNAGFHGGISADKMQPGYTPFSQNFVSTKDGITPRSGLSTIAGFPTSGIFGALGGGEYYDALGRPFNFFVTNRIAYWQPPGSVTWYTLGANVNAVDYSDYDFVSSDAIYDSTTTSTMVLFTGGSVEVPRFFNASNATLAIYSEFTWLYSLASTAKGVAAFDDRLVFFNTTDQASNTTNPQRLVWSPRGQPKNYTVSAGAGFKDIFDMHGAGTAVLPDNDSLVLFSTAEVWRARKRLDAFAFDFYPISRDIGCPFPKTAVSTPFGIFFLGQDFEVYLIKGDTISSVGQVDNTGPSRIQGYLRSMMKDAPRAWATWNNTDKRYELYFTDTYGAWPQRALYFDTHDGSWFPQTIGFPISYGFEGTDHDTQSVTWDEVMTPWENIRVTWDDLRFSGVSRSMHVYGAAQVHRFQSTQTNDTGLPIDCRWRTHALNSGSPFRYDELYETWIAYTAPSASSLSVYPTDNLGSSFLSEFGMPLSASSGTVGFAPMFFSAQAPQVELRIIDGGKPLITRLQLNTRDGGAYYGGR